ncbi:MAG: hypothetical protein LUC95_02480 [Lachnospiraceae bacterium]|nr:hypothetical protein [Lachnospiraceae bacterium]
MSLNFLKWMEGTADFKQEAGLLLLLFIGSIILIWRKANREGKALAVSGAVLAVCVFVPVTAVFLLMGYTGFYDWKDLLLVVPLTPVLALGGCLFVEEVSGIRRPDAEKGDTAIQRLPAAAAAACVIFLLLAAVNFHAFDEEEASDGYGIPAETLQVYESLRNVVGEGEMTILADGELLMYVRLYCPDWYPVYGRDLWDSQAAGYVEYTYGEETEIYEILSSASLTEEDADAFFSYVEETQPDCVIISREWETAPGDLPDYNLVTLTEQYIAYVITTEENR